MLFYPSELFWNKIRGKSWAKALLHQQDRILMLRTSFGENVIHHIANNFGPLHH